MGCAGMTDIVEVVVELEIELEVESRSRSRSRIGSCWINLVVIRKRIPLCYSASCIYWKRLIFSNLGNVWYVLIWSVSHSDSDWNVII